jgi:flagellar hook-basal body complex protein FliE
MFSDYLNSVNTHQQTAGAATEHFVLGEVPELHELMIALEKANVGLELTVALRDKLLEAYRELMRMQI